LACRFLHGFKVNKRAFKGIETPVVYIGFPESSLSKWLIEGMQQTQVEEKHVMLKIPAQVLGDSTILKNDYQTWRDLQPLINTKEKNREPKEESEGEELHLSANRQTLSGIMQRILAFPIENKTPLESMNFLADIKLRLAALI